MSRSIVPIRSLTQRLPEAGRIRIGAKVGSGGKTRPSSIDTFRFTSQDREAIDQVAARYGGEVTPWSDGHGTQWQVTTQANEIGIVLPSDPLGGTPIYELWSGGGCQRRCDGETAEVPGHDGMVETACICASKEAMECKPKVRLNVVLPDIKFAGTWRLETSSWNAVHELPGMVAMIQSLQSGGLTRGLLALEQRQSKSGKQTKNFVVPVLRVADSLEQLASGAAQVRALSPGASPTDPSTPALGGGTPFAVAEGTPSSEGSDDGQPVGEAGPSEDRKAAYKRAHAAFKEYGWDYEDQVKPALESVYGASLSKMAVADIDKMVKALREESERARFEEHFPYVVEVEA